MDGSARRWTASASIWVALAASSLTSLGVLWGLSWRGAEDAVATAISDQLVAEAALVGEHLRDVPVDVLVALGPGHASAAVTGELDRLTSAAGLHDAALLGPSDIVLGSEGSWLPGSADADLVARARAGEPVAGPLYRAADGALYLTAYAPLAGRPGWVVALEGSATLGAVDRLAVRQAFASLVVLVAVATVGAGLATWVARPLRRLESALLALRPGDPPERLVPAGPREVWRVATAARALLAAIRERDAEVDAVHRRELANVTRLAAEVAHEVRNPLNAMSLSIDRLARLDEADRRRQAAARLRAQVEELEAIVGRLVDLTRPLEPSPTAVDARQLVARLADEAEVALTWEGPPELVLTTDPTLLAQILRNLVLNARQAGARSVVVRASGAPSGRPSRGAGRTWALEVEDDGPGVADPEHLFQWFHSGRAQGSGLGLPVSRRMAEALGGSLTLAQPVPARFRLELPAGGAP